jgi:hypothetical protein
MTPKTTANAVVDDDSTSTSSTYSSVELPSPTISVGREWNQEIVRIDEDVLNLIRQGPTPFNASPIHFTKPKIIVIKTP